MNDLDALFNPQAITVIGASNNSMSPGKVIIQNLLMAGFNGTILPVNPRHVSVAGILCYPNVAAIPIKPDLAILCVDGNDLPTLFADLEVAGTKAAILIANKLYDAEQFDHLALLAKTHNIRLVGPNSLGVIMPWIQLNASLSPVNMQAGKIAFVSQSAAISTTVIDWAQDRDIGFSAFISIGSSVDITAAEVIDYLCMHSKTEAILLYVEHIKDARRFMSAARAAARNKRVLVLKGARSQAGKALSMMHHGGTKSLNIVYDSAFDRCGLLRVHSTHELFAAAETLTHSVPLKGKRLAILTNGAGPGVIATDVLENLGGKLAEFSDSTRTALQHIANECSFNPIDLSGDLHSQKLFRAFKILLDSKDADALLIMFSPSAISDPLATAEKILEIYQNHPNKNRVNLLSNWLGESSAKASRKLFSKAGIPTYRTPESSVTAFMHLIRYRASQIQLMETPHSIEHLFGVEREATKLLESVQAPSLTDEQSKQLLSYYQLPFEHDSNSHNLSISMQCDSTFGPVIFLGNGESVDDQNHVAGFPPLNQKLGQSLIKNGLNQGKIPKLSEIEYEQLTHILVRFSQLVIDLPKVKEISLRGGFNLLGTVTFSSAYVSVGDSNHRALSIQPYPIELEQDVTLKDGSVAILRPIRPEDEPLHAQFIKQVNKEDLYKRFFSDVGEFDHHALANLTQIDYDREMAFVLLQKDEIIGVVRAISDIGSNTAEFAALIRSDKKGQGLGRILMESIIAYSKDQKLNQLQGMTMPSNKGMVTLAKKLGFEIQVDFEEGVVDMTLSL